jgi:hypothetical protein
MSSSANRPKHTFARLAWEAISSENQQLNYTQNRSKINNIDRRSLKPPAILPRDFDAGKLGRMSGLILAKELSKRNASVPASRSNKSTVGFSASCSMPPR